MIEHGETAPRSANATVPGCSGLFSAFALALSLVLLVGKVGDIGGMGDMSWLIVFTPALVVVGMTVVAFAITALLVLIMALFARKG